MAISKETQSWLADLKATGKLSEEQFKALESAASDSTVDEFIKGSALRQSDYSRNMAEVQKAQKAVEDANRELQNKEAAVTKFQQDLGTWKTGAEEKFNKAIKDAEGSSTKLSAAVNRLKALAVANGLDESEVLKDLDVGVVEPAKVATSAIDTSKFLTTDQLKAQVTQAAQEAAMVDASIYDIASEHQRLFGTALPSAKNLVEGAIKAKQTLSQYWESTFKVAEKRAEATEKAIQERVDKAVKERETQILSEQALATQHPGGVPSTANSPVFKNENIVKPIAADHQPGSGISAAVAAHIAGKYRGGDK